MQRQVLSSRGLKPTTQPQFSQPSDGLNSLLHKKNRTKHGLEPVIDE